jgi:hypothetical protein
VDVVVVVVVDVVVVVVVVGFLVPAPAPPPHAARLTTRQIREDLRMPSAYHSPRRWTTCACGGPHCAQ